MPKTMKSKNELLMEIRDLQNRMIEIDFEKIKRKKTEEALKESMENFKALADNAYDCIMIGMEDGSFEYCNKRAIKVTGFTEKELLKMTVKDLTHPDEQRTAMKDFRGLLTGSGMARQLESIMVRKNGEPFHVELTASRTKWHGDPAVIAMFNDITERKIAEEALQDSEEKFRTLAEESPNMIFINDFSSVVYANKSAQKVMGYSEDEFYSESFDFKKLIANEDRERVIASFLKHKEGQEIPPLEYCFLSKDAEPIEVILTTKLIKYEGKPARLGIATDITERKLVEEQLKEKETQLRMTINSLHDAIHVIDKDHQVIMMNERFMNWNKELGFESDSIGKNIFELYPFLDDKVKSEYEQVFASGEALTTNEEITLDEAVISTETIKIPIIEGKKIEQVITVIRDITRQKKDEEKLLESAEQFKVLSDQNIMGILILQGGYLVYANKAISEISEFPPEEILTWGPEDYSKFIHPDDREFILTQAVKKQSGDEEGTVTSYTCRIITKNNNHKKVEIYSKTIKYGGKPADYVIINDLSRREKFE